MDEVAYYKIIDMYNNKEINRDYFEYEINNLTSDLKSPLKELYRIICYFKNYYYVPKEKRDYLINNSILLLESNIIDDNIKSIIKCAIMNASFSEYNYELSELYANDLLNDNIVDLKILNHLAEYYTKTRRYNIAGNIFNKLRNNYDDSLFQKNIKMYDDIINRIRKEYLPSKKDNIEKYVLFLNSIGIDLKVKKKQPDKIAKDDYPIPIEVKDSNFNSFVAFDVETTGIDHSRDAIIELSAIKVIDGVLVDDKKFMFQELVHPYKKSIPKVVENLTGISNEMVKDSKEIWEVFPEFVDFIGDNILVGYNCMTFDSKFLVRAGRLSNLIINNKYFDVMHMARKYKNIINSKNMTLVEVGKALDIENPQAHRALADAITTAKVYLKMKEMMYKNE